MTLNCFIIVIVVIIVILVIIVIIVSIVIIIVIILLFLRSSVIMYISYGSGMGVQDPGGGSHSCGGFIRVLHSVRRLWRYLDRPVVLQRLHYDDDDDYYDDYGYDYDDDDDYDYFEYC